jgi:serine/threonine-protein kinase
LAAWVREAVAEKTFGAHRVVEEIGSGALSTVHKAVQEPLGRTVAIKALKSTISPSSPFAAQLEREARVLGELSHPNIILLHDFVKTDTEMYLVLEYVDGWSLAEILEKRTSRGRKFSPELAAALGAQIARALSHAHERAVVHRDVKPSNVLITRRGEVKVVDFGIAQRERLPSADILLGATHEQGDRASRGAIGDNAAFGTPAYMSPEQILGEFVDARSDLFSLGVVLYQLLSGSRPFDRGSGAGPAGREPTRFRRDPPPPLRERAPEVPRALSVVVMRLLEKLPEDRYARADDVATLLEDFVRAKTRDSMAAVVARSLTELGLARGDRASVRPREPPAQREATSLRGVFGFALLGAVFIAGATLIQRGSGDEDDRASAMGKPLELVPPNAGGLRVVATPWAEVWVDGQRVDTTPFARPIPLPAGTHYVTLSHPNAPSERRVVQVTGGETALIEVAMRVEPAIAERTGLPGASGPSSRNASVPGAPDRDARAPGKEARKKGNEE